MIILKEHVGHVLKALINELKACIQSMDIIMDQDKIINQAIQNTAVYVGDRLLCLLLPSVKQIFSSFVSEATCTSNLHIEGNAQVPTVSSQLHVPVQLLLCLEDSDS